ncbi:glycosyltransferase [Caldicellulosiruptor bescii]|uniref:glycosyltransferase n=1 Tax=Caldicellulosiruptor bescii TaxID=31899 RepID=UPI002795AC07|nr:glycosyltransferase [Caldicellulosiruptor bescii]
MREYKKYGKGYSLKRGIYFAKGQYILTCDADLPVDIKKYFLPMLELLKRDEKVAAVFATALAIKTCRKERGFVRSIVSLIFFVFRQLLLQFPVSDTQLGFKLFRADVAKKFCQKVNENGFLFDLILTDLMLNEGYQIEEVNVKVVERKIKSSVSVAEIIKTTYKFCKYILFTRSKLLRKCTDKVMINDKSKSIKATSI